MFTQNYMFPVMNTYLRKTGYKSLRSDKIKSKEQIIIVRCANDDFNLFQVTMRT